MHCPSAAGIDLNKSADTLVHNNALIGTRGIGLRRAGTDAEIVNNIVDGRIWARDGAVFTAAGNIVAPGVSDKIYHDAAAGDLRLKNRSEEHTSELQSLMRHSYAVFCLKKKKQNTR